MSGILPPPGSINDLRTQALGVLAKRLATLDLTQLFVYIIDNVPLSALPFLAWQFDMLSPFWLLESPGLSQRTLIKQSIPLHRTLGTPATLKTVINNLGWSYCFLQEGQNSWGGNFWPSNEGWAVFRVNIHKIAPSSTPGLTDAELVALEAMHNNGLQSIPVTSAQQAQLLAAINFFKPARSVLDALQFDELSLIEPTLQMTDSFTLSLGPIQVEPPITITDLPLVIGWLPVDVFSRVATYNGTYYHGGGLLFNKVGPFLSSGPLIINGQVVSSD